jgi:hypothetical protein
VIITAGRPGRAALLVRAMDNIFGMHNIEILAPPAPAHRPATPGRPVRLHPDRRMVPAGLLPRLPAEKLRELLLLVGPDTQLRWHRDLTKRRHAATCAPKRRRRPRTRTESTTWTRFLHSQAGSLLACDFSRPAP